MKASEAPAEVLGSIALPGTFGAPAAARRYLRGRLPDHPALYDLTVGVSELVTNAVAHTLSGEAGGQVTVTLSRLADGIRADVSDDGGTCAVPHVVDASSVGEAAEHGRGLCILDGLADRWGVERRGRGVNVWFTITG